MKPLSILIPTLNEEARIGTLLQDLSSVQSAGCEIIVVDGGSQDSTRTVVSAYPGVRLVQADPPVGNQRQYAAEQAEGRWMLFLDADVRIAPLQIVRWVQYVQRKQLEISCPFYRTYGPSLGAKLSFLVLNFFFWLGQSRYPSGAGAGFLVSRKLWQKVGGLRSDLVYEDIEFIRRAARQGKFGIVPVWLRISDRRWVRDGTWKTLHTYFELSRYFLKNDFTGAERIHYRFGSYGESAADEQA